MAEPGNDRCRGSIFLVTEVRYGHGADMARFIEEAYDQILSDRMGGEAHAGASLPFMKQE